MAMVRQAVRRVSVMDTLLLGEQNSPDTMIPSVWWS